MAHYKTTHACDRWTAEWDRWGRSWSLMEIAQDAHPKNNAVPHPGRVLDLPPYLAYLPGGYPPYWGMYPYPYPQYVPPMSALSLGGTLAAMNTISSASRTEQCSPPASVEPVPGTQEMRPEPSPSPGENLGLPADMYDDMPPLEGPEDSDEGSEIEVQGTVCAVAPVQKGRGCRGR